MLPIIITISNDRMVTKLYNLEIDVGFDKKYSVVIL